MQYTFRIIAGRKTPSPSSEALRIIKWKNIKINQNDMLKKYQNTK
jgi:hypothetical protein